MNNNSPKPMNGLGNNNNNGPRPMNGLGNNNNNSPKPLNGLGNNNNSPKPMNGLGNNNNNGPKPMNGLGNNNKNGNGKKKGLFSKLFGKNNTPPPPMPSFGSSGPLNAGGNKLPLGGMPRMNGNGQPPGSVSMFGNRGGALPRRPGTNRNNGNFLGKLENLKNNVSNTKRNKI